MIQPRLAVDSARRRHARPRRASRIERDPPESQPTAIVRCRRTRRRAVWPNRSRGSPPTAGSSLTFRDQVDRCFDSASRESGDRLSYSALTAEQRTRTSFGVDDDEWRKWMNQHFYVRQGVSFKELNDTQREAGLALLRASLSAKGLKLTRDIMRLNHTLGELSNNDFEQYGEWLYHLTVMGEPSDTGALGLAARRPPHHHQLLRSRRPGGDDAILRRVRTGDRDVGQIQRDDRSSGGAGGGPRDDRRARRLPASEGDRARYPRPATTT